MSDFQNRLEERMLGNSPAFYFCGLCGVFLMLLILEWMIWSWVPTTKSIFESMNVELPTLTILILNFSDLCVMIPGWLIFLASLGIFAGVFLSFKDQKLVLQVPFLILFQSVFVFLIFLIGVPIVVPLYTLIRG